MRISIRTRINNLIIGILQCVWGRWRERQRETDINRERGRERERERNRVAVSNDYYHSYLHCMKQMISKPREWWNPLSNSHSIDITPSVKKSAIISHILHAYFDSITAFFSLTFLQQDCQEDREADAAKASIRESKVETCDKPLAAVGGTDCGISPISSVVFASFHVTFNLTFIIFHFLHLSLSLSLTLSLSLSLDRKSVV